MSGSDRPRALPVADSELLDAEIVTDKLGHHQWI
jgi:hypothetical protein